MKSRAKTGSDEIEFLRALSDVIRNTEKEQQCIVDLEFHPTEQPGVFCWHLTANGPIVDVGLLCKLASIKDKYPSARNGSLAAFLYGLAVKLDQMVAEQREVLNGTPHER